MIVYDKRTGFIDAVVPNLDYAYHYPKEFKDNLATLELEEYPKDIFNYRVVNGVLVRMSDIEIEEKRIYGRILTEEERFEKQMLDKLKPTLEEIRKAENTIEILTLIQEVM